MKRFCIGVDTNDRHAMVEFLAGHTRYDTMRSWNRATSYANCVKIHRLDLTQEQMDRAWAMLDMPEVFAAGRAIMDEWSASYGWQWQAHFNGRSGGYLVLYRGGVDCKEAFTAKCGTCGRLTWRKSETPCTTGGCSGTLGVLGEPRRMIVTHSGQAVDQSADFGEWEIAELRERVRLVQDFDLLCDRVVDEFVLYCERFRVVEKTVKVRKRIKMLEPVPA